MSDDYFDYDAFFGDSRSPGTSSINTVSLSLFICFATNRRGISRLRVHRRKATAKSRVASRPHIRWMLTSTIRLLTSTNSVENSKETRRLIIQQTQFSSRSDIFMNDATVDLDGFSSFLNENVRRFAVQCSWMMIISLAEFSDAERRFNFRKFILQLWSSRTTDRRTISFIVLGR